MLQRSLVQAISTLLAFQCGGEMGKAFFHGRILHCRTNGLRCLAQIVALASAQHRRGFRCDFAKYREAIATPIIAYSIDRKSGDDSADRCCAGNPSCKNRPR